jgi:hypothetical protein
LVHPLLRNRNADEETTMKQFLKSMFAVLRKTNEAKTAKALKHPSPTPALELRSQVKAGMKNFSINF